MNKWIGIEEFVATIKTGSLSQAAIDLSTSKSNISKKIAQLESRLNTKLVYRHKQRIALTAIGKIYYEQAMTLLDALYQADARVSNEQDLMVGEIKLLVPPGVTESVLIPIIHNFRLQYPQVTFSFISSVKSSCLLENQADLAFRYSPTIEEHLIARPLFSNTYRLCASPEFIDRNGHPQHPNALASLDCLNYASQLTTQAAQWTFQHHSSLEKVTVSPKTVLQSNSVDSLVKLCQLGSGILYCSNIFVQQALNEHSLHSLLDDWINDSNQLWLVYVDRQAQSKRVKTFIAYTLSQMHLLGI